MKEKILQTFSDDYINYCRQLTPEQIIDFIEQFRRIAHASSTCKTKLISLRVPIDLLEAFKLKARANGQSYQIVIKSLMRDWLLDNSKT